MTDPLSAGAPPPAPPVPPVSGRPGNPWDRRDQLGFVAAFIENLKLFVTAPTRAYDETREKGDFAGPLIFAIVIGWICAAIKQIWGAMLASSLISMLPPELDETLGPMMVGSSMGLLIHLLLAPIFIVIGLLVISAVLHACLALVGALSGSSAGFEGTFRVVCFAIVARLGQILPVVGDLLTLVWGVILCVIGFTSLHRTTQGKALGAILIPCILCCVCFLLGVFVFGFSMAAMMSSQ